MAEKIDKNCTEISRISKNKNKTLPEDGLNVGKLPFVGERVMVGVSLGTVKYVGRVEGAEGVWLGVDWDDERRGRHDGSTNSVRCVKQHQPSLFLLFSHFF